MSAFVLTSLLAMAFTGSVYAQHGGHGGGGHGGGGGFHGGGGGFHGGGGGSRGGSSFHGGGGAFRGGAGFRGGVTNRGAIGMRGGAGVRGGAIYRGGTAYRGGTRGGVYSYRGGRNYGGRYYGGGYRGGYYRGGGYRGYGGFRFGLGWGYPHFGLYFGSLPFGYYPFYWDSDPYYYYGGVFYRPYNGGYEVTAPPIGATVPNLPSNAQSIIIDGVQYYEASGVYYQPDVDSSGRTVYIVVGRDGVLSTDNGGGNVNGQPLSDTEDPLINNSPADNSANVQNSTPQTNVAAVAKVGDVVDQLPPDCRKVILNKKTYYVSPDNVFFEDFKDADGKGYRVASVPPPGADQN
jgi:hypothetical protein